MLSRNSKEQTYQGILRPLRRGAKSRFNFGVYDIECPSKEALDFYCCGFYDGEQYTCFYNLDDFLNHVLTKEYAGWRFFAHFGGRFDVHYIFDYIRAHYPDAPMEINCSGSCVISLTVRQGKLRWRFCDSYRLLEASLESLTKEFDVKHKKLVGLDFKNKIYNEHDCRGLYEVLELFFDQFDICSETIASHAMRVFRSNFMHKDLYQPYREIEEFVRASYFGGRCEIYRFDKAEVNHYDINSLYPTAMLQAVPVNYLFQTKEIPDGTDSRIGFYRAIVTYPDCYLPVLPVSLDKLYFPVGSFQGTFTSMELQKASEQKAEIKILEGRLFQAEPLMAEFATELFKLKAEAELAGNSAQRYIVKKVLNSLYGKWGQRREQRTFMIDTGEPGVYPLPNGLCYREMESRATFINPHISSCITSRARLMIYEYLSKSRNWYTDTDSLFTDSELPVSGELGAMKFEGRGEFQAYRLKEYKFASEYKIKGLPRCRDADKDAAARLAIDNELAELYLTGHIVERERMRGWTESVRRGEPTVQRVMQSRQFREVREKRARSGFDTRPWNISELLVA